MPPESIASVIESRLAASDGVIADDRTAPLFRLVTRLRELEGSAWWHMRVVDQELLSQGAPTDIILQALALPEKVPVPVVARSLEACLVDHPRLQMCHSVAMPGALLHAVQPAEPSSLLPPLHYLPVCDEAKCLLLVKEYSDGVRLLDWRQARAGKLRLGDVLDLLDTLGDALATLHRRGHAHGAMTPELVAMQERALPQVPGRPLETVWVAKVVDIGLVRHLAAPGRWPTGSGALWCAPEVFEPDPMTDWRRVDQLALAALLYALWTNNIPFEAVPEGIPPAEARRLRARQIEALPPPRGSTLARALGVTPAMSSACLRAMSPEPAERFPTLDAFSAALRRAAREAHRGKGDERDDLTLVETGEENPAGGLLARFRALTVPGPVAVSGETPQPSVVIGPSETQAFPAPAAEAVTAPGAGRPPQEPVAPAAPEPAVPPEPVPSAPPAAPVLPAPAVTEPPVVLSAQDVTPAMPSIAAVSAPIPVQPPVAEAPAPAAAAAAAPSAAPQAVPDEAPDLLLPPAASSQWGFNRLAALLLILWVATLAFLYLRETAPSPEPAFEANEPIRRRPVPHAPPAAPALAPAPGEPAAPAPGGPTRP